MFSENICLWYDEEREEHDRYIAECDAKEALAEFCRLCYAVEEHELTDEQFSRLPDNTFPDDSELRYMNCEELKSVTEEIDECIGTLQDILAEVTKH